MTIAELGHETDFHFPSRASAKEKQRDILTAKLQASLRREEALRRENGDLLQRQLMLVQEFEHRLFNGLQLISSMLSLQSSDGNT